MANRKSMLHTMVEDLKNSSPPLLSPLRRRSSMAPPRPAGTELEENDDEAERVSRRKEQNQPAASRNDKRKSLGLSFVAQMTHPQIAEKVSQCIKLSAENKINVKNAFKLEMIDFMTYMIKKQDADMSNLQMASTSLDVSTKIYGFRVDGVHDDILKMIGGLDKQEKNDARRQGGEENVDGAPGEDQGPAECQPKNKKKRRNKQRILSTLESLRGTVATLNPASFILDENDSQTTDLLYQAVLPHHANNGIYLNEYNDVILDTVNPSCELAINATHFACPTIENFGNLEMCESFANFEFLGYSPENEDENTDVDRSNSEPRTPDKSRSFHDAFQFDLDASLPPDDEPVYGTNDFDVENVERCGVEHPGAANIVDFREEVVRTARHNKESEYSYVQENIGLQWAGPSHWKIRFPTKNLGSSRIVEGCGQEAVRRKKELLIAYNDDTTSACELKFDTTSSNLVKIQTKTARTWSEEKLILPEDKHYDAIQFSRLYLRPSVLVDFPKRDLINATHVSDEIGDYDYNNENDTTDYCPNIECNDDNPPGDGGDSPIDGPPTPANFTEEAGPLTQAFTSDNLVEAPKINPKIFIPYSQRAKKIDMRQLKKCIWKDLSSKPARDDADKVPQEPEEKITETKKFSDLYKNLPKILSAANVEALSIPIAVMSLLHLANEKTLRVMSNEVHSELFISQD